MNARQAAIQTALSRSVIDVQPPSNRISDYFATNVFTQETMHKHMSAEAFQSVLDAIKSNKKINRNIADQVAIAMKAWAIEKGATSYCHWFQPLTGATAERHDTFFTPINSSKGMESFSGNALVQQTPDGSSFPSGGLRATFEARGYTAWDPSSPAFIMSVGSSGKTLCIPTIFVSYTGDSLDYKAPLLKSQHFLETAALPVCHYFDRHVNKITPMLGWEQEYFLIDRALYYARPDLVATGRTLLGASTSKGQQLADHYFGSIPERVYAYMLDFETEALKLGIAINTRHNEVAPSQYECAAIYTEANVAVDQNQLLMDIMGRVARRHGLKILFHEKPFAGINGSGKHNNWSLATDTGKNLLAVGKTPRTNLQFLTFFINTLKAISQHPDLLRAVIASEGNDLRLGINEAPPTIMSVFIGSTLTNILAKLEKKVKKGILDEYEKTELKLDIHKNIPDLLIANTDSNRTAPIAFTGNKFEFRGVGASSNCAALMTVLNTIVGQQLTKFKEEVDHLISEGDRKDGAIFRVLRRYIGDCKKILSEGDNYGEAWKKTATKRGLSNITNTPDALTHLLSDATKQLFTHNHIFSERELSARYAIQLDIYCRKIDIATRVLTEMVNTQIIPNVIQYQNQLLTNLQGLKALQPKSPYTQKRLQLLTALSQIIQNIQVDLDTLQETQATHQTANSKAEKAAAYHNQLLPLFTKIRQQADELEGIVADEFWVLPKYWELLFIR